jgi:orotidine-5'-phosphate decarboxylase
MNRQELIDQIKHKRSFLCIGLDTDPAKIPDHLLNLGEPVFEFNKRIIDATADLAVAYKPNIAFYEYRGTEGWLSLEKTINYLNRKYPQIFTIADAKRGDIGNTSEMYARAFLKNLDFDAVTVAPYMGEDSIKPFLSVNNKWVILLALTSNKGAADFQFIENKSGKKLFEQVLKTSSEWGNPRNLMYVVGATKAEKLVDIRKIIPEHFLLIPGVGAQGGNLQDVSKFGMNNDCGLLVNSSRGILYADDTEHFADAARNKARELQSQMDILLKNKGI